MRYRQHSYDRELAGVQLTSSILATSCCSHRPKMSLDATLENLNDTLQQVASLLHAIEVAVIVIAVALAVTLIACTGIFYYSKYKKYRVPASKEDGPYKAFPSSGSYQRGKYDPILSKPSSVLSA